MPKRKQMVTLFCSVICQVADIRQYHMKSSWLLLRNKHFTKDLYLCYLWGHLGFSWCHLGYSRCHLGFTCSCLLLWHSNMVLMYIWWCTLIGYVTVTSRQLLWVDVASLVLELEHRFKYYIFNGHASEWIEIEELSKAHFKIGLALLE